jgi:hypothetical protein
MPTYGIPHCGILRGLIQDLPTWIWWNKEGLKTMFLHPAAGKECQRRSTSRYLRIPPNKSSTKLRRREMKQGLQVSEANSDCSSFLVGQSRITDQVAIYTWLISETRRRPVFWWSWQDSSVIRAESLKNADWRAMSSIFHQAKSHGLQQCEATGNFSNPKLYN